MSARHAIIWSSTVANTTTDLGTLGGQNSVGNAINFDGSVVVGMAQIVSGENRAFRWTPLSGMVDLGVLPGGSSSKANGVSSDGSIVVGESSVPSGGRAVRWTIGLGMDDLGVLAGDNFSTAYGVSADGLVIVGYSSDFVNHNEAFRWTALNGMTGLGSLVPGTRSFANGVSGDGGTIVGSATAAGGFARAVSWTGPMNSVITDLGTLGGLVSSASAASADGDVIVGNSQTAGGATRAFRFTTAGGMLSVEDWLRGLGATIPADVTNFATGVSADGDIVVGELFDVASGNGHAFVARGASSSPGGGNPPAGIMDVESYGESLATAPRVESVVQEADLTINGANSSPMFNLLSAGQWSVWTSGDIGRMEAKSWDGTSAVGEAGLSYAPTDTFIARLALGATYAKQDLYLNGDNRLRGGYVLPEAIVNLGGNFYGTLTGYANWGDMKQERAYSNGAGTNTSKGETDTRTLGFRARLDWLNAFSVGSADVSPYASFTHTSTHIDGYTEKTGPFPATFDGATQRANVARLGGDAVLPLNEALSLIGRAEYAHRFESRAKGVSGGIVGLTDFTFTGQTVRQDWVRGGLGFKAKVGPGEALVLVNGSSQTKRGTYWLNASYRIVY